MPVDGPERCVPLPAFSAVGIELEYMIVDRATLDVRPVADALLGRLAGRPGASDARRGDFGASNELVQHVIELKNRTPSASLEALQAPLQSLVQAVDDALAPAAARLLPGGMHPWMDPRRETVLWPHAGAAIYRAYDRIFDCRRHGYANLQAMHVNLPFANDAQFASLHAAVRLVLPLVPALAASSPFAEGRVAGDLDHRLCVYRDNAAGYPAIAGRVIPETVGSRAEYELQVLVPMYRAIAPVDPDRLLQHEWLNSRGAIPRFDRHAIEIRLADTQECPYADLAVAAALISVVRALYDERHSPLREQQAITTDSLVATLAATIRDADRAMIDAPDYQRILGLPEGPLAAREAWVRLLHQAAPADAVWRPAWQTFEERGPLARRILAATGPAPSRRQLHEVYVGLADSLAAGTLFDPA